MKTADQRKKDYERGYATAMKLRGEPLGELEAKLMSACYCIRGFFYKRKDGTEDYKLIVTNETQGYLDGLRKLIDDAARVENATEMPEEIKGRIIHVLYDGEEER